MGHSAPAGVYFLSILITRVSMVSDTLEVLTKFIFLLLEFTTWESIARCSLLYQVKLKLYEVILCITMFCK